MTQIERRQARIRRIRQRLNKTVKLPDPQESISRPDARYVIGKTQNHPENILLFNQRHAEDPAVKVMESHLHCYKSQY